MKHYTYELYDPQSTTPFYVGKGSGDRWKAHITEAHKPVPQQHNPYKCNIIRQVEARGENIYCVKQYHPTEAEAFKQEVDLIQRHGRLLDGSGYLTNITEGGNGGASNVVYAFDLLGNLIGEFSSQRDAADHFNMTESGISSVISGKQQCSNGMVFSRTLTPPSHAKALYVLYELKNKQICEVEVFDSLAKISKYINLNPSAVSSAAARSTLILNRYLIYKYGIAPQNIVRKEYYSQGVRFKTLKAAISYTGADRSSIIKATKIPGRRASGRTWSVIYTAYIWSANQLL